MVETATNKTFIETIYPIEGVDLVKKGLKDVMDEHFRRGKEVRHGNILGYENMFIKNEELHLLTRFSKNTTLEDLVASKGGLGEETTAFYTKNILEGLNYLHSQNIKEINLKPGKIVIG